MPGNVVWEVTETTQHPDRITLRLRDGSFLPLVSQMDVETAKKLHAELGTIIALHDAPRSSAELPDNQKVANDLAGILADAGIAGCRRIEVEVREGHVVISGETRSAEVKETVLELIREHPSVDTVDDRLVINASLRD